MYRIVQESLTNVIKHAGPAANAQVVLAYGRGQLQVSVVDDGRGGATPGDEGHGLVGMRERVQLQGGSLRAAPRTAAGSRCWPSCRCESGGPRSPLRATATIRVYLVDDQLLVRSGFRMLIEAQPDMTVVGEAADGPGGRRTGPAARLRGTSTWR